MQIEKTDFVAIPSQDGERARAFYGETLGLRQDQHARYEFWAGDTCLGIWEPERMGGTFEPSKNGHIAFQVPDVPAARAELEARSSRTRPALRSGSRTSPPRSTRCAPPAPT